MLKRFLSITLVTWLVVLSGCAEANSFPDFTKLVEKVQPSVVSIKVEVKRWGRVVGRGGGSGFIVDDKGYILTNHHVIDGAETPVVKLYNGREFKAEVVGSDANTDVALLKIDSGDLELEALEIGTTKDLRVGQWVLAFGAPFNLEHTVTAGIVSAKGRGEVGSQYVPFIQTDVAINRGNSGGPLINLDGEVVGINSMIFNPMISSGLSFSIPIDLADNVREQLLKDGRVNRGFLGVMFGPIDQDKADAFGLDSVGGALVTRVMPNMAADKAGIKVGDVVIEVDGKPVRKAQDLPFYIGQMPAGEEVELTIVRNGDEESIDVTLSDANGQFAVTSNTGKQELGIAVSALTPDLKEATGIEQGVIIRDVERDSPAARAGLRQGDIIQKLHRTVIRSPEDFQQAVASLPKEGKVAVLIVRQGVGSDFLVIELK
ncbi:Do family serine endopeptidase [Kangiella spongicola]|uniref:Probable periplasmic serine endoprotease DegP-like n=1 Tax=Kangiella spongicola TaxID=796379 RepID=A0A318D2Q4_9GAMM|nr:Do family serine endopeptidase [Kangiella spongicola]PXF63241.1 protease Do [Kangiella spongicola]